jgi:flagellar protein FliS
MFGTTGNRAAAYAKVGLETSVPGADPHQLIVLLFDGALRAVANARMHMERRETAEKGKAISWAIDIICNGLKVSLNMEAGGDLAGRLAALYDYMVNRLLFANVNDDLSALEEISALLGELKSAWVEIAKDPVVLSANRAAA